MSALVLQALLGYYQHYRFLRDKPPTRPWFNYVHIVCGTILVVMGIFNCPSGLTLARVSDKYVNVWWGVSSVLVISYAVACISKTFLAKRRRQCRAHETPNEESIKSSKRADEFQVQSKGELS